MEDQLFRKIIRTYKQTKQNLEMKKIVSGIVFLLIFSSYQLAAQVISKASMDRGQKVYEATCLTCHQSDGLGVQSMNPTIVKTKWILGNKRSLIKIVLNGLKGGEIEIDGDSFHNPMPPQATLLSDQQIADVLTYVRNSFGNKASAVIPSEVKAARGIAKSVTKKPVKKTASNK
jgi:mono/diheme cytochrome c family protein